MRNTEPVESQRTEETGRFSGRNGGLGEMLSNELFSAYENAVAPSKVIMETQLVRPIEKSPNLTEKEKSSHYNLIGYGMNIIQEATEYKIPIGLYEEALETYESISPTLVTKKCAIYWLNLDDWSHLVDMAECHLYGQIVGADNEDGHVTRCKRYMKQLQQRKNQYATRP